MCETIVASQLVAYLKIKRSRPALHLAKLDTQKTREGNSSKSFADTLFLFGCERFLVCHER